MSGYSNECRKINTYNELLGDVSRGRFPLGVLGVAAVHKALLIHSLCEDRDSRAFVITQDDASAGRLCADLKALGTRAQVFPGRDLSFVSEQTYS